MMHTSDSDEILSVGIMLTCAAGLCAAVGLQMLTGFIVGVLITLFAAAIAGADLD